MSAWYNEIDPFKAEVLRQAIKAGAIAAEWERFVSMATRLTAKSRKRGSK